MEKQKIIKIVVAVIVAFFAIVYYFLSNSKSSEYENIVTSEVIVSNTSNHEEVKETSKIKVYVTGEVNSPGVIELEEGARIEDAIQGAGGIKAEANLKEINLAYEVEDGEKIYVPNLLEEAENAENQVPSSEVQTSSSSNSNGKVNINKASATELTAVPGIGASTAQKIVTYRDENGKFKAIEDIKNVSGIGDSKYNSMKDFICVK